MTRIDPISSGIPAGQLSWTIIRPSTWSYDVRRKFGEHKEAKVTGSFARGAQTTRFDLPSPDLPSPPPYENDIRDSIQQTAAPITQLSI